MARSTFNLSYIKCFECDVNQLIKLLGLVPPVNDDKKEN